MNFAASCGRGPLVRALLEVGADPNATTSHGMNALDLALESKSEKSIEALLEHGAQVELFIYGGGELIQQSMARHGANTIVKLVMAQHVENSAEEGSVVTVLHVAAEGGNIAVIRLLLDNDFNIVRSDNLGRTPLHVVAKCGHRQVVELLLLRKADALTTCNSKSTALHSSAENGHLETTRTLLTSLQASSRNIDVRDSNGRIPMYLAIANGHTDVVRLFIKMGGDHMIKDCDGIRAHYWAGKRGHWKVVRLLSLHERKIAPPSPRDPPPPVCVDPMILRWD